MNGISIAWAIFWIISTLVVGGSINATFSAELVFNLDSLVKVANILIAPLTVALVFLTKVLADESQKTRLQSIEPHIVVTLEPSRYINHFNIVIENVGSGPGFGIRVLLDPDISFKRNSGEKRISELSIMSIPVLKPRQSLTSYLANYSEFSGKITTFTCHSVDSNGRLHVNVNNVDISIYEGMSRLGGNDIEKISNNIEGIRRRIDSVTYSNNRIAVDIHSQTDRLRERKEQEDLIKEWESEQPTGENM